MLIRPLLTCFDGDGDGDGDGGDDGDGEKKFSQTELNTILADEKRKQQQKQRDLAAELADIKKNKSLTDEQKEALEKNIEDLKAQYMTSEERARRAQDETQKKTTQTIEQLTLERDQAQTAHSSLVIDNAITRAASDYSAIRAEQIAALLIPKTKLTETLNETGEATGRFEPRVTFDDVDKEGQSITLELSVPETVKRMRELPKYGNLFESDKSGGLGQTGGTKNTKNIDIAKLAREDPAAYRKTRREKPELFA